MLFVCTSLGLLGFVDELGYTKVVVKGVGEPALIEVMKEAKKRRIHETILKGPPAYDPPSQWIGGKGCARGERAIAMCQVGTGI